LEANETRVKSGFHKGLGAKTHWNFRFRMFKSIAPGVLEVKLSENSRRRANRAPDIDCPISSHADYSTIDSKSRQALFRNILKGRAAQAIPSGRLGPKKEQRRS